VFHRSLSPDTVYSRYFSNLTLDQRTAHERLVRICFADYDRDLALVAVEGASAGADGAPDVIAAIGRLSRSAVDASAEFAIVVGDGYQGEGLGTELLRRLVDIGRREGIERIEADILPTNGSMLRIAQRLGFTTREAGPVVRAELSLR
jgi:acetyltransferase